jgi:hypothetical protein
MRSRIAKRWHWGERSFNGFLVTLVTGTEAVLGTKEVAAEGGPVEVSTFAQLQCTIN